MGDHEILVEFLDMPLEDADPVFERFMEIPGAAVRGAALEKFLFVPGTRQNRVLLVAHADTVWDSHYGKPACGPRKLVEEDGVIRNTSGGLGADDRAGCAILWLLRDLGHSLLVTSGEEQGQQGSGWLMAHNPDMAAEISRNHQFAVQFDRRNGTDYKCYDVGTDAFRRYVEEATGYSEPDRCSTTDIRTLCREICGVNLSVGYREEHHAGEHLVVAEWQNTLDLCRRWLSLPVLPRFERNGGDRKGRS